VPHGAASGAATGKPVATRPVATAFAPSLRLTIVPEAVDAVAPPRLEVVTPTPKVEDRAARRTGQVRPVGAHAAPGAPPVLERIDQTAHADGAIPSSPTEEPPATAQVGNPAAAKVTDPAPPTVEPTIATTPVALEPTIATTPVALEPTIATIPVALELPTRSTGPLPWEQPRVAVRPPRAAGERPLVISSPASPRRPAPVRTAVARADVPWADAPKARTLPAAAHNGPPPWAAAGPAASERHLA